MHRAPSQGIHIEEGDPANRIPLGKTLQDAAQDALIIARDTETTPEAPVKSRTAFHLAAYFSAASIILRTAAFSSSSLSCVGTHCWVITGSGRLNFAFSSSSYTCLGPSGAQP